MEFDSPWDRQKLMYRIAILEEFHKSGLQLFDNSKEFKYDIINDVSEENLINILPQYDGCTLRVSNLTENILKNVINWK